ncbi:MAG: pyridoxal 5'-phosphate synthase glutaminase subunit PdxT, partial [Proteobacteria bacterium]
MAVGILALQGAVEPHISHIENLGQSAVKVRSAADLQEIERLILPGGESSTMLNLMQRHELMEPLREFGRRRPIWGVCAGAILLANEVVSPKQPSLKLMAIRATRNFYGSQLNSFKKEVSIEPLGIDVKADFIRAPKLERLSSNV